MSSYEEAEYPVLMNFCFVHPREAISIVAGAVGAEARRDLLADALAAWVDELPEADLERHYADALATLDAEDLAAIATWQGSVQAGLPLANRGFLLGAFGGLGEHRRDALKLAAGYRGERLADDVEVGEQRAIDFVVSCLPREAQQELAGTAARLYVEDLTGALN